MKVLKIVSIATLISLVFLSTLTYAGDVKPSAESNSDEHHRLMSFRTGVSIGFWQGNFKEYYQNVGSSINLTPAYGASLFIGLGAGPIFVDWSPTYLAVGKVSSSPITSNSNAYYLGLLGFELGFSVMRMFPFIPLELLLGYENGSMGFSTGTQTHLSGDTWKAGVCVFVPFFKKNQVGIRAEWRRHLMSIDNAGSLPVGNSAATYYFGLTYMFVTR